ncbi:MAG: ribosome recycling factor [Candidatus Magasanikbacteria bacterium]|nr:ribosome recycling factor [Candidatus Magasanikbacteria bacterium]
MQINDFKKDFESVMAFLKTDLTQLRTGRASTAMAEGIMVEAYGTRQPIKAVASLTVSDAKTLAVEPWDKGLLGAVEKGIRDSGLGINPVNDGRVIRLALPELTSERRTELVKVLHQKLEQARVSVRKIREDMRGLIAGEEKDKSISEDEKYRLQEDLEKMVKGFVEQINSIGEGKEKEIITV